MHQNMSPYLVSPCSDEALHFARRECEKNKAALHYVVSQYLKSPRANLLAKWFHDSQALGAAYVAKVAALNENWPVMCGPDMRSPHTPPVLYFAAT